ncbi:hypothetical protein V6M29_18230 [Stutzerimonas chloritidismutans]|uniref:hypothetical protein n=1 Tax=Pseudomonadaceae TaxID=135621 RepID=UPI000694794C|nr:MULTISPECIES: hypothetical protein [Pseudomonas]ARS47129.1 hypothetical protein PSMEN_01615 [Pseudomonas mendocina]MBB4059463.1 FtsZ-binding cell division protein ZapB [Pseudomonas koreensis]MBI6601000.1 hypothetical protein [Pseudomonas sp. S4_EA_1b]
MSVITEYRAALQRLIAGNPTIVPRESKINNDSVALEAGRKRGSIKKSRGEFLPLIREIREAAEDSAKGRTVNKHDEAITRIDSLKLELSQLKQEHEALLVKYLSLLHYNHQLQQENKRLGGSENLIGESIKLGKERS